MGNACMRCPKNSRIYRSRQPRNHREICLQAGSNGGPVHARISVCAIVVDGVAMDPIISPARELPAHAAGTAFGETLGIDVPTRYSADIHSTVSAMLAVDSLVTPLLLGMSGKTV